ncbi:MAM and fibronectin type III domain-containing protein 1 [Exaiptasia diaphana]|uniref:Fibronectin type-III domain-containing protein n=1 Tax=Exaiptasia diaphana TaxID=2652724 RepID=A0A913YPW9_EXADI|nr:MAM and fibronectin type III domain-containing protein 1 [Exaiptasia diaphana]
MFSSFFVLENGLGNFPPIKSWNISSSMKTSTSINVSWDEYPGNESVSKYFVICTARKVSFASTDGKKNSLVVQYLLKNTKYNVTVLAILGNSSCFNCARVDGTIFKSQEVIVKTRRDDVPSTPPQHVKAWTSGSTVVVSWKPVDKDFTNGVIVGYYVYYRKARWHSWVLPLKKVYIKPNKTKAYLKFSWSYERYWIEVSAATKFGEGPRSRKIYITSPLYVPTWDYTRIWW